MREIFLKQLKQLGVSKKNKILLALSGGVDSMVLMDLLKKNHFRFAIAHCNFSLRKKDSDLDQNFIKSISKINNIEFFIKKFNTKNYAIKNKISIQMAARELRYDWFSSIKKEHNFDFILTGHHNDDSVETVLINLIRGTGFSGFHGIKLRHDTLVRPLLVFNKEDIISYAKKNHIDYKEDSSNTDNKYIRNKVRNEIIPLMQEINPNLINSIGATISRVNDVEKIYQQCIVEKKQKIVNKLNGEYKIDIKKLQQEVSAKQILYEIISDFGFSDIDSIFNSLSSKSGREFFNANFYMIKDRNELIISKHLSKDNVLIYKKTKDINSPFNISFNVCSYDLFDLNARLEKEICIDYSKLEFPLSIRPWKNGDVFIPLGMKGFKKVSDYFIDKKFSLIQKKKSRLLISNNKIVCIIGERLDDRFKLVQDSKKVYIVTV